MLFYFSSANPTGGFSYSLTYDLKFANLALSQATILSQVQSGIDYYASQGSIIASTIANSLPGYTYSPIDATSIKNTIQITQSGTITPAPIPYTYTASLTDVLVLTSSSSSKVDPDIVFNCLSTLVINF
jgi:hypothetical protein